MTQKKRRKDADEVILEFFAGRLLSPTDLSRGCQPGKISHATYFRHKKKLLEQLRIEQLERISENGKIVKLLREVRPGELADSRDIEQFLDEAEDCDEVISARGMRDLHRLCQNRRVAYYFSPKNSARFKTDEEVEEFFEQKLIDDADDKRFHFLQILYTILERELTGSLWKRNLLQRCRQTIEAIAWEEQDTNIRAWSIELLIQISDERLYDDQTLLGLGYSIIKDDRISNQDFETLLPKVKKLLIERKSADKRRHETRRYLNNLAIENPFWKRRVEMVLA